MILCTSHQTLSVMIRVGHLLSNKRFRQVTEHRLKPIIE